MRAWCRVEKIITRKKKIPRLNWKSVCIGGAQWIQSERVHLEIQKKTELAWILLNFFAPLMLLYLLVVGYCLKSGHIFCCSGGHRKKATRRNRRFSAYQQRRRRKSRHEHVQRRDKLKKLFHNCRRWWSVPGTNSFSRERTRAKRVMMNFAHTHFFPSSTEAMKRRSGMRMGDER